MEPQDIAELVIYVSSIWPNFKPNPMTPKAWERLLGDVSKPAAVAAIDSFASLGEAFPPIVGQIRKAALEATTDAIPGVDEAWAEVMSQVQRIGSTSFYDDGELPTWSHPAISAAVNALSWREVCQSENQEALRAHFNRYYETARKRKEAEVSMPRSMKELLEAETIKALSK